MMVRRFDDDLGWIKHQELQTEAIYTERSPIEVKIQCELIGLPLESRLSLAFV